MQFNSVPPKCSSGHQQKSSMFLSIVRTKSLPRKSNAWRIHWNSTSTWILVKPGLHYSLSLSIYAAIKPDHKLTDIDWKWHSLFRTVRIEELKTLLLSQWIFSLLNPFKHFIPADIIWSVIIVFILYLVLLSRRLIRTLTQC